VEPDCNCPIATSLQVFGDRWSLIVLRDVLFLGKRHFHEFSDSPERISSNVLSDRLKNLEAEELLVSEVDASDKRRKIYTPTQKAKDLAPILQALADWGMKYATAEEQITKPSDST
jgi:DNA-binding HxlR family transcriptional regulator